MSRDRLFPYNFIKNALRKMSFPIKSRGGFPPNMTTIKKYY